MHSMPGRHSCRHSTVVNTYTHIHASMYTDRIIGYSGINRGGKTAFDPNKNTKVKGQERSGTCLTASYMSLL